MSKIDWMDNRGGKNRIEKSNNENGVNINNHLYLHDNSQDLRSWKMRGSEGKGDQTDVPWGHRLSAKALQAETYNMKSDINEKLEEMEWEQKKLWSGRCAGKQGRTQRTRRS